MPQTSERRASHALSQEDDTSAIIAMLRAPQTPALITATRIKGNKENIGDVSS